MSEKVEILINRRSRSAKRILTSIKNELHTHGFEVVYVHEITARQSIETTLEVINKRKPALLVVCSGDGTVSTVVDYFVGSNIELGLIPLGTTNNFARSLDIPLDDIAAAIQILKSKRARAIDLGKIGSDYFTNVAGIGLSAHIASAVDDKVKARWGRAAYALTGFGQLLLRRPFVATVQDPDRELSVTFETFQVIVANGRYHAGREIAQDARMDNGQLLIFPLGGASRISFILHMIDFYIGKRKKIIHSSYLVGRRVQILTSAPQPVELDGEVKLQTPALASVETAAIKVRY